MTVQEFLGKVHLPAVVAHFGWEQPKLYRKIPSHGWYAQSRDNSITFNAIDLFGFCYADSPKMDDCSYMMECYRYYTRDHPELLEIPIGYSETTETRLWNDYLNFRAQNKFYSACREEALYGEAMFRAKRCKFTRLLEDQGMPEFIHTGVGLYSQRIAGLREFDILKLHKKYDGYSLLVPSFFAPNNCLSGMDVCMLGDMSKRRAIYRRGEAGWQGLLCNNIVGNLNTLMTVRGCTWHPSLCTWLNGERVTLHNSLEPHQLIEIWTNLDNLMADRNPLTLIKRKDFDRAVRESLGKLNVHQLTELENITGEKLWHDWLAARTTECSVGGIRFLNNRGRYYYERNHSPIEFANFSVELTRLCKEDGVFYQHGHVTMHEQTTPFKIRRKSFCSYQQLIAELTDVLLEAGMGVPVIAPNLKHYLVNVIEAFNPVNKVEKPKAEVTLENTGERLLHTAD